MVRNGEHKNKIVLSALEEKTDSPRVTRDDIPRSQLSPVHEEVSCHFITKKVC